MIGPVKGCLVVFAEDMSEHEAEAIMNAIRCMRRVIAVEASVADQADFAARRRIREELYDKLIGVLGRGW